MIQGSNEQKTSTLSLRLRRCKPRRLSMLDGQLKQSVEGEVKTIPPPEIAASSPSGAIGHINSEVTDRAAPAPTSRAAQAPTSRAESTPIRKDGSAGSAPAGSVGSAPSPVVTHTTEHVRQGDNDTEDQVRQRITEGRQGVRQMVTEGRQGNIAVTKKLELESGNIITAKNENGVSSPRRSSRRTCTTST